MSQDKQLMFLYNTAFGRVLMKLIFERPYFSKISSIYYKSSLSKNKIPIEHRVNYKNFNDYFTRKEDTLSNESLKELKKVIKWKN